MKRAAIIITDAEAVEVVYGFGYGRVAHTDEVPTSERLLADLRLVTDHVFGVPDLEWPAVRDAAARVRALLAKGDDENPPRAG